MSNERLPLMAVLVFCTCLTHLLILDLRVAHEATLNALLEADTGLTKGLTEDGHAGLMELPPAVR